MSKLDAWSWAPYVPSWRGEVPPEVGNVREFVFALKDMRPFIDHSGKAYDAAQVAADNMELAWASPDVVLVPAPSSTKTTASRELETGPGRLALRLGSRHGLAVSPVLQRTVTVPKAAHAARNGKPRTTVKEHLDSMAIARPLPRRVVIVDDVLTQGTQVMACALMLGSAGVEVVAAVTAARVVEPSEATVFGWRRAVVAYSHGDAYSSRVDVLP